MKVRVKETATMFAEDPYAAPSTYAGREGWTVESRFPEYDVGVIWEADEDQNTPCHFMWYELERIL